MQSPSGSHSFVNKKDCVYCFQSSNQLNYEIYGKTKSEEFKSSIETLMFIERICLIMSYMQLQLHSVSQTSLMRLKTPTKPLLTIFFTVMDCPLFYNQCDNFFC
jgi:hypothetical protein